MIAGAPIVSADAMRAAESARFASGVTQHELMARAGAAVARETARFAMGQPVLVLAGPGNNGGDGFAAARLLAAMGLDVTVATLGDEWRGAAGAMRAGWSGPIVPLSEAPERPVIVDGLFGIGLSRPIEGGVAGAIRRLRGAARFVLAIDIASGLDADSGTAMGMVLRAEATLALGALKRGHVQGAGIGASGALLLDPIGIPIGSDVTMLARPRIAAPGSDDHKYTRGLVGIHGGAMAGAARLSAAAAARGGAGYVVLASDDARVPFDAVVHRNAIDADKAAAALIGPGLGRDAGARAAVRAWLASDRPLVMDGDALALLSVEALAARPAPTILTPHGGEFERLFGPVEGDRIAATLDAARITGAVIVHKGAATIIAAPDGRAWMAHPFAWLSTAGTGDVLAGLAAARLAVVGEPVQAACEAVWLHARAARLAGPALVADDLPMQLPTAIAECL